MLHHLKLLNNMTIFTMHKYNTIRSIKFNLNPKINYLNFHRSMLIGGEKNTHTWLINGTISPATFNSTILKFLKKSS